MQRVYSVCSPKPTNDQLALQETVFHNANGYLGVRGTLAGRGAAGHGYHARRLCERLL